jgi:hypothetical protein
MDVGRKSFVHGGYRPARGPQNSPRRVAIAERQVMRMFGFTRWPPRARHCGGGSTSAACASRPPHPGAPIPSRRLVLRAARLHQKLRQQRATRARHHAVADLRLIAQLGGDGFDERPAIVGMQVAGVAEEIAHRFVGERERT